ncbi:MAG: glycosyltransferase, partial [Xenococcaceae cyanobacterium]
MTLKIMDGSAKNQNNILVKQRPIRILQVVGGMVRGGIETWLINVLRQIDRERFQIDILVHTNEQCAYDEEVRALGCQIIHCAYTSKPWLYASKFNQILQDYGPYDIVHSQVYLYSGFILYLATQAKIPIKIAHIHPYTDIREKNFWRSIYLRLMTESISQNATHILVPSKKSLEAFEAICNCRDRS